MKRINYIFAAALAVLACSCSKEQTVVADGSEVNVSFTAELPGIQTKSISDGLTAKNLTVEVYEDENGEAGANITALQQTATFTALKTNVTFNLVKGKTYHFIFWAQADNAPYTLDATNKTVAINYSGAANDENRDAFYAVKTLKVQGAASEPVQLHRPFAQVNFGTADFEEAVAGGVNITKSTFTATDAAKTFDVFAGEGKDAVDLTYTEAELPAETLVLKDGTEYTWMAMNYFIPAGRLSETHVSNVKAQLISAAHSVEVSSPSTPVQANWRTNIVGNLLTDQVIFNVEIVPAYEDDIDIDVKNITTSAGLRTALANGYSAKLAADVTIDGTVTVPAGKDAVIDLNGHTVSNTTDLWNESTRAWSLISVRGGKLTIKGAGALKAKANDCFAVDVQNGGEVIIEDGEYVGNLDAVYVTEGTAIIKGGKFSIQQLNTAAGREYAYVLNCLDANYKNGTAKIIVYGGEFENFNPGDCAAEGLHTSFLAPGYFSNKISDNPEVYAVTAAPSFVVATAEELKTMLTTLTSAGAGNNTVEIADDIELKAGETWTPVKVDGYHGAGVITVKGNGHTIKGLNAPLFDGGFAGKSGIVVTDLTVEGMTIVDDANTLGIGAFVSSIDSMEKIELINCHLINSTITSTGGARVGGLIGWTAGYDKQDDGPVDTYVTIRNCSVEGCKITAKGSAGAIIGHAGSNAATYQTVSDCTVKDCDLNSTDEGGWRVGVVVGTANIGQLTINNTTESGNTLTQTGKTAPTGQSNLYGRFVPGTTGKLTIDGVAIK